MAKLHGKLSKFYLPIGAENALAEVGQLKSFNYTGTEKRSQEVTELGEQHARYLPTTTDWGTATVTFWHDPSTSGHAAIQTIMEKTAADAVTSGNTAFQIDYSNGTRRIAGVGIMSFDHIGDANTDGFVEATVTIKVDGKPTFSTITP